MKKFATAKRITADRRSRSTEFQRKGLRKESSFAITRSSLLPRSERSGYMKVTAFINYSSFAKFKTNVAIVVANRTTPIVRSRLVQPLA